MMMIISLSILPTASKKTDHRSSRSLSENELGIELCHVLFLPLFEPEVERLLDDSTIGQRADL